MFFFAECAFVTLHWCHRGCEGQRLLRCDSFAFETETRPSKWCQRTTKEALKIRQVTKRRKECTVLDEDGMHFEVLSVKVKSQARSLFSKTEATVPSHRRCMVQKQAAWHKYPIIDDERDLSWSEIVQSLY